MTENSGVEKVYDTIANQNLLLSNCWDDWANRCSSGDF